MDREDLRDVFATVLFVVVLCFAALCSIVAFRLAA